MFLILVCAVAGLAAACSGPDAASPSPEAHEEPESKETASPPAGPTPDVSTPTPGPTPVTRTRTSARTVERGSGLPVHDFELTLFDGQSLRLSDLRGKVVVLNFWASWCPPCRAEMPDFQEMWEEMRDEDVVFVGIALGESERSARAFAETTGVTYPLGLDETGRISRDYRVTSLPTTVLIDREGNESLRLGIANQGALRIFVQSKLNDG
ncbi:MAG: TlpA family protein disulfide reductase [Chloroflexi bacterium]|nr:TlpA family protein disulfide reductase [Chloroflexota bacterium]